MKLANEINELLGGGQAVWTEAGNTSADAGHWHKHQIDNGGHGKTIITLPEGHPDHVHEIIGWEVQEVDGHSHKIEA